MVTAGRDLLADGDPKNKQIKSWDEYHTSSAQASALDVGLPVGLGLTPPGSLSPKSISPFYSKNNVLPTEG